MENWRRIKEALEESGTTENFYYKRAVSVLKGNGDPLDLNKVMKETEEIED